VIAPVRLVCRLTLSGCKTMYAYTCTFEVVNGTQAQNKSNQCASFELKRPELSKVKTPHPKMTLIFSSPCSLAAGGLRARATSSTTHKAQCSGRVRPSATKRTATYMLTRLHLCFLADRTIVTVELLAWLSSVVCLFV